MAKTLPPSQMSAPAALKLVREIAAVSGNIMVTAHARKRQLERQVSTLDIQRCLLKGVIVEGPFLNPQANWQMTMKRFAAGEELEVALALDLPARVIVITVI